MKNLYTVVALVVVLFVAFLSSEKAEANVSTTLSDYAYDFSSVGYEIEVTATSQYHNPLNSGDYFRLIDGAYTMNTLFDGLSRKGRKNFEKFYNAECEYAFGDRICKVTAAGEVELDSSMKMILTANVITVTGAKTGETITFK